MDRNELEKCLYTTSEPDEALFSCVVAFDANHAVTYRHGHHSQLHENDVIIIYNVLDQKISFKCRVIAISDPHDIIVFALESGVFPSVPRGLTTMHGGQKYMQLGIGQNRMPTWKQGVISDHYLKYYIGSSHKERGDSGSAILSNSGFFLGTSVGNNDFCFDDLNKLTLSDVPDHHPGTKIISADVISGICGSRGHDLGPPENIPTYDDIPEYGD